MIIRFKGDAFTLNLQVSVAKSSEGHTIGVDVAKMLREDNANKSIIDSSTIGGQLHNIGSHHHASKYDHVERKSPRKSPRNNFDSYSYSRSKSSYGGDRPGSSSVSINSSSVTIDRHSDRHHVADHADSERYRRELHEMKDLNSEKSIIISKLKLELKHRDDTIEELRHKLLNAKIDDH
jgi:hypothetical protein